MTRKKAEPNYELLFKSAVTGLQIAYDDYKTARKKELGMTWVGMDGTFVELNGIGDVRWKASEYLHEVQRLKAEVEKYRNLMEGAENARRNE